MSERKQHDRHPNFQPERFAELKRRVAKGRVELVNSFFLEPTINLSGGEALAQNGHRGSALAAAGHGRPSALLLGD